MPKNRSPLTLWESHRFKSAGKPSSGSVVQKGNSISGTWFESVNRVGGRITWQYNGGLMEARAEGDIVAALLTVKTMGARQSFLMEAPGAWAEQVSIDLHR